MGNLAAPVDNTHVLKGAECMLISGMLLVQSAVALALCEVTASATQEHFLGNLGQLAIWLIVVVSLQEAHASPSTRWHATANVVKVQASNRIVLKDDKHGTISHSALTNLLHQPRGYVLESWSNAVL